MAHRPGERRRELVRSHPNSAGTLRSESETERKPEVPAAPRGEALFRCARPSGVPTLHKGTQLCQVTLQTLQFSLFALYFRRVVLKEQRELVISQMQCA